MTSAAVLVGDTRNYIRAGRVPHIDEVGEAYEPGSGVLKLKHSNRGILPSTVLSVGWSDFYVWEYDQGSQTAQVRAGWNGSPDVEHEPGDLVVSETRWTDWQILGQLNLELSSLSGQGGLWERLVCYNTWDGSHTSFDLAFERPVARVLAVEAESARTWEWWQLNPSSWRFTGDAMVDEFPSGQSLSIYNFDFMSAGRRLRTQGAAPLLPLEPDSTDAAASTGLAPSALDVPMLGVAARLAGLEEQRRNQLDAAGDPAKVERVPMTAWTSVARDLRRTYEGRLAEERANLLALTPYRRGV